MFIKKNEEKKRNVFKIFERKQKNALRYYILI